MVTGLQHVGGLNPRGFRHVQHLGRPLAAANNVVSGPPGPKSILDGSLLIHYLDLGFAQQQELAHAVGSSVDRILDDLIQMTRSLPYF